MPDVSFSFEPSDIVSRVMSFGSPTPIEVAVSGPNLAANHAFAETGSRAARQQIPSLARRAVRPGTRLPHGGRERGSPEGRPDGREDGRRVALAGDGHLVEPVRRAQLLGRPEQRRRLPGPGAGSAGAHGLARTGEEPAGHRPRRPESSCCATSRKSPKAPPSASIERYNMQRMVTVTANIAGADLGSVARQVSQAVKHAGPAARRGERHRARPESCRCSRCSTACAPACCWRWWSSSCCWRPTSSR